MPQRYTGYRRAGFQSLFDHSPFFFDRSPSPHYMTASLNRYLLGSVHLSLRGHLLMCPHRAASVVSYASSRWFIPVAYDSGSLYDYDFLWTQLGTNGSARSRASVIQRRRYGHQGVAGGFIFWWARRGVGMTWTETRFEFLSQFSARFSITTGSLSPFSSSSETGTSFAQNAVDLNSRLVVPGGKSNKQYRE